ncbi:MAG: PAS domain S-box protein [Caldimonas sp.]
MVRRVGRIVIAAAAIGAVLLVANAAVSVYHTAQLRNESAAVLRSNELLLALDNVLSLVKDAESGQRGYVITGREEYLAPYRAAVGSIQAQLNSLEGLTRADPVQQRLMADLRRHTGAVLGELDLTIGLRDRKGFDLTRDVIALGAGRAEMEGLRASAAEIAAHESLRLVARGAATDRIFRAALFGEALAGLAALAALIGFTFLLARHLRARDEAETVISAQGERLRTTLASIGDAVITTDLDGRVTDLNPVAESLTGWAIEAARGQPLETVFRIVNESTREPVENPAARALRDGVVVGLANHTVLIRKDGSETPIDDSAAPIRDAQGQVHGCILVFRDISQRKAAERELDEAQARLQRVVSDMAIPTMVFAEDGEILLVNEAWTGISGYGAAELATIPAWTMKAYGARAESMNELIGSLFDLEQSIDNGEREIVTASGEKRIWHFVTAPIGADGKGRRMLVTNAIDVTERRRLDQVLVEEEARMRLAMDAASYGGWQWDRGSGETVWTDKTRELLDVGADEPISFELFQQRLHPDDRPLRERAIAEAWVTGVLRAEYRVVRRDGELRWISSRGRVVRGADGSERMLGVVGDVTEQKRAFAALEDADRRKDEFLATLAHELRNPLAPLRNSLAILQRSADDPATFEKSSGVMERQLSHLVRLIDDLLDVSRISLDKLTLRVELADLAAIVEHAVEANRPAAERAGHVLEVRLPERPVKLQADRARLAQAFSNLVGNACKFTPDGGRVVLDARVEGERAVFSVSDNGIGIDAEQLGGVFEMFAQIDNSLERAQGGLGIGLTLVRRLVEMHGGTVVARSAGRGEGSEFVVTLPLTQEAVDATSVATPPAAAPPSGRLRMLVVDDNGDSAESLAMLLSLAGHETHVAYSGTEALARADSLRPDAVLLDLGLPGLSGYEVCRRLRAAAWAREIPIVAITGWGQSDDRQRSKDAGFDGHLVKPVVFGELTALLDESLR